MSFLVNLRKHQARFVRVAAVEQGHIADALYELRGGFRAYLTDQAIPRLPVADGDAHLEQFMAVEREIEFIADRGGIAGVADHDHRFEFVAEAAQVVFLFFRE